LASWVDASKMIVGCRFFHRTVAAVHERALHVCTRCLLTLTPGLALAAWCLVAGAADPPGGDDWKYDKVVRRKGPPLIGLVVEQNESQVLFKCILRQPGRPTLIFNEVLPRQEIQHLELLDDADRELLQQRLKNLVREREQLQAHLKLLVGTNPNVPAVDALHLEQVPWPPNPQVQARTYRSTTFVLVSTASEEVVQLSAIQLEQVYAAYARYLAPRRAGKPTTILLTGSLTDYQVLLRDTGHNFFNPAFYDVARNQIVCGSDLQRLCAERERVRQRHIMLRADLEKQRAELQRVYNGRVPPELLAPIQEALMQIPAKEQANDQAFDQARARLFRRLYHEAFHAYLSAFVYPDVEVPHWLNEGLAQIFETAIVEVGELRVGHADKERLEAIRLALSRGTLLPTADLLRSSPRQFLVAHAAEKQASDRHYLASWGLTFYLTFERRILNTRTMDDYIAALQRQVDPLEAFRALVGQPLPEFEKDYHQYLKNLRQDGTVAQGPR
jgi:hypothetical protein